ncbi:MAG: hypothetical protein HY678_07420 [Chloroflexi bacterium]|nr:hypothetical protein [Chloroflexota bacterium]
MRLAYGALLAVGASLFAFIACGGGQASPTATSAAQAKTQAKSATPTPSIRTQGESRVIEIYLSEPTGTHQTGRATLTETAGKTRIQVEVSPPMAGAQPMHVHTGTCRAVGPIAAALDNVVSGNSETTLDMPLSQLTTGDKVINVHLSFSDIRTYTACGEIPKLPGG